MNGVNIISENGKVGVPPLLSVGVLTYPDRWEVFNKLRTKILDALEGYEVEVEFLTIHSPKGAPKIGTKRNLFLDAAKGVYCVMIDDDDDIVENYFDEVIPILKRDSPDSIGHLIDCEFYEDGTLTHYAKAIVSNEFVGLSGNKKDGFDYAQGTYYKVPILTKLAKLVRFKDISFAEDQDFSLRLKPFLRIESFINKALYIYKYDKKTGETRAIRYGDKTLK